METLDTIDEHQRRILNEYQSVTHSEDIEASIRILANNDWNLELAVQNRYTPIVNKRATTIYEQEEEEDEQSSPSSTSALLGDQGARTRNNNRRATWFFMWPFNLVWKMSWNLFQMAARLLYRPSITAPRRDARSEADKFLRDFEHTYGTTHPKFFEGGYTQALTTAKKELKYALVILCSEEHDDNDKFCKETLSQSDLLEFLHHHQVIVWGGNVRYTEAFQVSNTLQATTYPFLAIIALQTNKMAVIDRIEGPVTSSAIIRRFESVITRIGPSLNHLRMEREQRELERRLRQEQDNAYKSSLLADQEKERKANQEKLERERIERQKLDKERLRHEYLQYLVGIFPEQDNTFGDEKVTKISFRLTNGERVIRKFSGSDSLRVLYEFVEVYPYLNTLEPLDQPPENYTHEFKFSIHSPFPRTVYQPDSETKLADVKGLWPSATLIVDTEEEEEE